MGEKRGRKETTNQNEICRKSHKDTSYFISWLKCAKKKNQGIKIPPWFKYDQVHHTDKWLFRFISPS